MTQPPTPIEVPENATPLSEITYAPDAIKKWENSYGAINIFNSRIPLPQSHFRIMQQKADPKSITCFRHGVDELTFFI